MLCQAAIIFPFNLPNKQNNIFYEFSMVESWWLNTVLAVCECMPCAKSWQEKGCSSQVGTWQVKNILMKDFD